MILIPKGVIDPERLKVRPICLLPEVSKIFEKVLVDRLTNWMEEHSEANLSPNQYGFRRQKSTVDAIIELREIIELTHKRDGGIVIAIDLDISNAFNSLQWADICSAMREKKFSVYVQLIIYNYLSNRELIYVNNDGNTMTRLVEAGVPHLR